MFIRLVDRGTVAGDVVRQGFHLILPWPSARAGAASALRAGAAKRGHVYQAAARVDRARRRAHAGERPVRAQQVVCDHAEASEASPRRTA